MASFLPALMNAKALAFSLAFLATAAPALGAKPNKPNRAYAAHSLKGAPRYGYYK